MEQNNSEEQKKIEVNNTETGNIFPETNTVNNAENNPAQETPVSTEKTTTGNTENLADNPSLQEAWHTAATAMSDAMPMSGISTKKIAKTFLKNIALWVFPALFALTMFFMYKCSSQTNLQARSNLANVYDRGITFFLDKNPEKAEEQRQRIIESYLSADKLDQDRWKRAWEEANNSENAAALIDELKEAFGDSGSCRKESLKTLMQKADAGNVIRQFLLGTMYAEGKCLDKDAVKAKEYFEKAVSKGYRPAMNILGEIYEAEEDYQKAISLYRESAENGYKYGQYNLGRMYIQNRTDDYPFYKRFFRVSREEYNAERAEYWFRRASDQGLPQAQHKLGVMYWLAYREENHQTEKKIYSKMLLPDPAEAERLLNRASSQGNTDAMTALADMYDYGEGFPQQKEMAFHLLEKAADKGNELAELKMAIKFHIGDMIQKNDSEALKRFNALIKKNNKYAKDFLAKMYLNGDGVFTNYEKTFLLFKDIIENDKDLNYLLDMSLLAETVQDDKFLATSIVEYLENSIKNLDLQNDERFVRQDIKGAILAKMGELFFNGTNVIPKDYDKSLMYFEAATKAGNLSAKIRTIELFELEKVDYNHIDKGNIIANVSGIVGEFEKKFEIDYLPLTSIGKRYYDKAENTKKGLFYNVPLLNHFDRKYRYYKKSAKYFSESLKDHSYDYVAATYLGLMYLGGKGVKTDFSKSFDYLSKNPEVSFGFLYIFLFWNPAWDSANEQERIKMFSEDFAIAAAKISPDNAFAIGFITYLNDISANKMLDLTTSLECIKEASNNGNLAAKDFMFEFDNGLNSREKWLEKLADEQSSYAALGLGDLYFQKKDNATAQYWYEKSALRENPYAQFKLGNLYYDGIEGKSPDFKMAAELFSKAADNNNFMAAFKLGLMYKYGIGIPMNMQKSREYLDKAFALLPILRFSTEANSKLGRYAEVFYKLHSGLSFPYDQMNGFANIKTTDYNGNKYFWGFLTKEEQNVDREKALKEIHALAYKDNYVFAQEELGEMYTFGIGVNQNYRKAKILFEKAAQQGLCVSIDNLAQIYGNGLGVKKDLYKARELLYQGAIQEGQQCSNCQYALAYMYYKNEITPIKNEEGVLHWLHKAAEQGYYYAYGLIGEIYEKGELTEQDYNEALKWYLKAAEQNDSVSSLFVGNFYYYGNGVKTDYKKAFNWYSKAAEQDLPDAQFMLGKMYEEGKGVIQNYSKAVFQYRKAAIKGHPNAQYKLGYMYENGFGVLKNDDEAKKWYVLASIPDEKVAKEMFTKFETQGKNQDDFSPLEELDMGNMFYFNQDYGKALEWYRKAAEHGNVEANFNLGIMYYKGEGVKQDYAEAVKWWSKSADHGDAYAQYILGRMYEKGLGVQKNPKESYKWYEKAAKWYGNAAEQGDADAQNSLGLMYYKGQGVKQDYDKAFKLFKKSAEQGDFGGYGSLGECYYKGHGTEKDYAKAFELCKLSANQNNEGGQQCLGVLYENGWGVKQDYNKALEYYKLSAEQDYDEAQYNLAQMYEKGLGVPADKAEAIKWYEKAAAQGHEDAKKALERIVKH